MLRQVDLKRAIKTARAAGLEILRLEILADGRIVLITANNGESSLTSDLDRWMEKQRAASP